MAKRKIRSVLATPRLAVEAAADPGVGRLRQIATALEAALRACHTCDAERQLRRLTWLLCRRCGGRACDRSAGQPDGCAASQHCSLGLAPARQSGD